MESCSSDEENDVPVFNKESDSEDRSVKYLIENNSGNSGTSCEKFLENEMTDVTAGDDNGVSNENNFVEGEGSNGSNVKFLSSEFFDQFICQPSTSKDNPEIMIKQDNKKDSESIVQPSMSTRSEFIEKTNLEREAESLPYGGCRLRKNIEQRDEENVIFSETSKNVQGNNTPFQHFGNYAPPFNFLQTDKKTFTSSEEYFSELRSWLQQAFFWQSVTAAFPYFLMCQQFGQTPNLSHQQTPPGFNFPPQYSFPLSQFPGVRQQTNIPTNSSVPGQPAAQRPQITDGVECRIPSFWKRIAAEFIDFMILFFVKIAVTYVAIDFFHLVDLDQLDILQKDSKLAYKQFMQITQEIVILELIHRLVVCAFETFWLRGGHNGQIGGATPGKSIMGLRVIHCESSVFVRENEGVVIVRPGTNLGLTTAFFRSVTKNFVLALLVPTSFAFIFFPHNRTGYDMICSTIVVEDPIIPNRIDE